MADEQVATEATPTTDTPVVEVSTATEAAPEVEPETPQGIAPEPPRQEAGIPSEKHKTAKDRKDQIQAQIKTLTWEKHEAARELEATKAQLEEYRKHISASQNIEPTRENFEDEDKYIDARAQWIAKQAITQTLAQEREERRAERANSLLQDFTAKAKTEGLEKHDDYMEVVYNPYIPYSNVLREAVFENNAGVDIAYFLGKNPHEAARLANIPDKNALNRELKILEGRISTPKETKPEAPPMPPKIPSAPPPIKPIGGTGGLVDKDPTKMTMDEWIVWRRGNIKKQKE